MPVSYDLYETIVGLEVHAQLLTQSKLFCSDSAIYTDEPNIYISPITLAHPGALPMTNKKAIEYAVKMGLACHCEIVRENYFARKNYFYPDLPKGYQISQHTTPICKGGFVKIKTSSAEKIIRLNRIHLEEDAGKSLHDLDKENTYIDFNRAGVPLIEIVTEPDICSGEEAYQYLTELRRLLRYLEICDGNMEEGSLRCDANVSVRKKGEIKLGTKVEIKNLNSIRNVKHAIEYESKRMINELEKGNAILQQTKSFNADSGTTFPIRDKEEADDYRYFPEPDLTPFILENEFIEKVKRTIPALQEERIKKYISEFHLSEYDATVLTEEKEFSEYFEKIIADLSLQNYKAAANWMLGPIRSWMNENNETIEKFPVQPEKISLLIALIESGKVNFSIASSRVFPQLIKEPGKDPEQIAEELHLIQRSDLAFIEPLVDEVLLKFAEKVKEYKKGKKGLLALFVGEVMKRSGGKVNPEIANEIILNKLKSQ